MPDGTGAKTRATGTGEVLLCPVGSTGDLHPLLAVGVELLRRGQRVAVLGNEVHEAASRRAGCEFVSVQSAELQRRTYADPQAWDYATGYRRLLSHNAVEPLRRLHAAVVARYVLGRTVVVAHPQAFGARLARDTHAIPTVTACLTPSSLRSARGILRMPRPMLVGRWLWRWYVDLQYWCADRFVLDPRCAPELNAYRRELGLPPIRRVLHRWSNSPDAVLAMFPEWWAPPQPEWPRPTIQVGFPSYDGEETTPLTPPTERFLAAGESPIVFSPGASNLHTPTFFAAASEACLRLGRRGLILTPQAEPLSATLPPHMHCSRFEPFTKLLAQAATVVHQGGIGTAAACLRAGRPQVCIPTIFNQPDTAERLRRFGVSQTILPRRFTVDRLTRALSEILDRPEVDRRCRELAQRCGPPEAAAVRAADVVESLFSSGIESS